MSNMSYCRFQNTLSDLRDCYYALGDYLDNNATEEEKANASDNYKEDNGKVRLLSKDETDAKYELMNLCRQIIDEYGDQDGNHN